MSCQTIFNNSSFLEDRWLLLAAGLPPVSADPTVVSALYAEVVALRGDVPAIHPSICRLDGAGYRGGDEP